MSDTNDAGGNAGDGTNNDGGAQNQGGDGKNQQQSGDRGSGGQGGQSSSGTQGTTDKTFTQGDLDRIIADRLARERQKFETDLATARDNAAKPLQDQLNELRKSLADRNAKDVERNGKLALSTVHTMLAEAGIRKADVKDVLDAFDPTRLLKDGEPDDEAIAKFARGLSKVAGRAAPDPDQGQNGSGGSPQTMGDVMRQMARDRR